MTKFIGTLTEPGTINIPDIFRYEHHKITIVVSSFVSDVVIKIEDVSVGEYNPINLNGSNKSYTLSSNGGSNYLIENERFDKLRVNFVSGDAVLNIYYGGW